MDEVTEHRTPEYGTEDYRRWSVLFNDVTRAPIGSHLLFSDRLAVTHHLWAQGWRRDVRPEDITRGEDVALGGGGIKAMVGRDDAGVSR